MKKIICLVGISLLVTSLVFAGAPAKKALKAADLPGLKGTWSGGGNFATSESFGLTLEILNDKAPLEAKTTWANLPQRIMQYLPATVQTNTFTSEVRKLTLSDQGTLVFNDGYNFVEFTVMANGKMNVWFWVFGASKGTATLTKK